MRIAIVTDTYVPEINGVARTTHRLVEGLLARGHAVQVVRPRPAREQPVSPGGIEEIFVGGLEIPIYRSLRVGLPRKKSLEIAWSRRRPDIVHVATEGPL